MKHIAIIITAISLLANSIQAEKEPELYKMHATAYILKGKTASGEEVRHGICASGHREWMGKTIIIYQRKPDGSVGDMIGIYECLDTGCKDTIIDVWCDGMDEAKEFAKKTWADGCKGKIYVQVIDAKG